MQSQGTGQLLCQSPAKPEINKPAQTQGISKRMTNDDAFHTLDLQLMDLTKKTKWCMQKSNEIHKFFIFSILMEKCLAT